MYFRFLVKALVAGVGTFAMGRALVAFYETEPDYAVANRAVAEALSRARHAAGSVLASRMSAPERG